MDAIGYSSAKIVPEKVSIFYGDVQAVEYGCQYNVDHQEMVDAVSEKELMITVNLELGMVKPQFIRVIVLKDTL